MESPTNTLFSIPLNHCLRVAPPVCIYLVFDFSPVPLFPASFLPVIIPVIGFPFDTYTLTPFLPFIFPPVTYTSLLSCPFSLPLLYCRILPCHLPACLVSCRSFSNVFSGNRLTSSQSPFLILLVTTLLLPTVLSVSSLSIPLVVLIILISIP